MSLENLLNHTCDIYHIQKEDIAMDYGLPTSHSFYYAEKPDISSQKCHFGVNSQNTSITQTEPANIMESKIKLTLPIETDIRINDKIIDCMTGLEYTAEQPVYIRNHHIFVYIKKVGEEKML
ncbi:MAG: DUF3599 family protein [Firmicutes bacterium]|jgi:hypothetical protein|nr:DUF3599 family protein [Bacillota bacterium]